MVKATYSRRHRLKNKEDLQANVTTAGTSKYVTAGDEALHKTNASARPSAGGRKRTADPGLDSAQVVSNPRKKQKLTKEAASAGMSIQPFQTPFPTVQAQSQVFRLPSSKPQPSPEEHGSALLSPVPIQAANVPKSKIPKENQIRKSGNTSRYTETLKSIPSVGNSSKTLASVTLTSEAFRSGHDIRLSSRHHGLESRSGSRSTSCSSSNSNPSRNVKGKSKLKHTQSLTSLKTDQKKAKKKQKPGRSKITYTKVPSSRTLSSTGLMTNLPLESPFVSRASSPVEIADEDAVAVTQHRSRLMGPPPFPDARKRTSSSHGLRTALSDTFYNPNLPSNAGKTQSADTLPQKVDLTKVDALRSKIKTTFSSRAENRMPRQGNALVMNDRQRRPSAPSWLHPPRPKKRFSERPFMQGEKNTTGNVPLEKQKLRLSSGLNIVLGSKTRPPQESADTDVPRNAQKQKAPQDPDDAVEWMHSRRDVNFDRPPSRMSIGGSGFGYEFGFEYGEVEGSDVFLSSEEGEDEDEEEEDVHEMMETQRKPLGQRIQEDYARRQRISPLDLDATGIDQNFDTLFGKDAVIESTPQKLSFDHQDLNLKAKGLNGYETDVNAVDRKRLATLTRTHSLPNVSTTVTLSLLSSSSSPVAQPGISKPNIVQKSTNIKDKSEDQDGEVDMELTGDAVTTAIKVSQAGRKGDAGEKTLDQLDADLTPWVTDSIISPPTLYFAMKTKKKGDAQVGLDEKAGRGNAVVQEQRKIGERESRGLHILQPMKPSSPFRLSSPFRPSETSTDTTDHSSFNLIPDREELHERERTLAVAQDNDELHLANPKRTRSGTIVPAGAPTGARRTRSGTIVGPLPPAPAPARPLPAVPSASGSANEKVGAEPKTGLVLPKRTRSGTIIASSAGSGPGLGSLNGGRTRTRSGSVLSVNANGVHTINVMTDGHSTNDQTGEVGNNVDFQNPLDEIQAEDPVSDVECYVDSVYLPPLTSSPDPIDFLRFASIVEEDEEPENMAWFVADDPPSPVVSRNKKAGGGLFRSGRFGSFRNKLGGRGGYAKGKGKKKTRFLGRDGKEERAESEGHDELEDEDLSDDELLLLPGPPQT